MIGKTVLVIEDEPDHLEIVKLILEQQDYNVISSRSGEEALELLQKRKPDLVICDVILPGIDGFEVCKRIKEDPSLSKIPVIILSVRADQKDKEKGIEMGASAYITKPFNLEELISKVKDLLKNG